MKPSMFVQKNNSLRILAFRHISSTFTCRACHSERFHQVSLLEDASSLECKRLEDTDSLTQIEIGIGHIATGSHEALMSLTVY